MKKAIIIGAGVTGLTAAWQLAQAGLDVQILEVNDHVGGMSATFRHGDFLLDLGPHKFFSVMEDRMALSEKIMAEEFITVPKRSRIRLAGRFLNYPIGLVDVALNLNPWIAVSGGLSYAWQLLANLFDRSEPVSYEDWLVKRFGRCLYELIFGQYARKVWGDPRTLARSLAETRVAIPGLFTLVWRMLFAAHKGPVIHAETFRYPRLGSGRFSERLLEMAVQNGARLSLNSPLNDLRVVDGRVAAYKVGSGDWIEVDADDVLVTTLPVGYLARMISPAPEGAVLQAAEDLRTRDLILLYLVLDRPSVSQDNWLFFPERKYIFNRLFEQKNFSTEMAPADKTVLCLEIIVSSQEIEESAPAALYEKALAGLEECGLVKRSEVKEYFTRKVHWAYPVYDLDYQENTEKVYAYLDGISNLYSVGRQGGFSYIGQIDCLDVGIVTAEHILRGQGKNGWQAARRHFADYIVLD